MRYTTPFLLLALLSTGAAAVELRGSKSASARGGRKTRSAA